MGVLSWLKSLRKTRGEEPSESATVDAEHKQDARKADIGGTLFVRGSAQSEAERLAGDD